MRRFPAEFAQLLNKHGQKILDRAVAQQTTSRTRRIFIFRNLISHRLVQDYCDLLDRTLYKYLRPMNAPISPDSIRKMKTNYSETLEKTMRVKSGDLNRRSSRLYERAHDVGLTEMLRSDSLHRFAELAAGVKLRRKCGRQVICYEAGDYVGPHNDHHPEDRSLRRGYIDVHLMFSNQYVKTQLLIYEQDGYLVNVFEMNVPSAMAIYRLPFWHYTTPLVAKSGMERLARRWLLLASFEFETTRDGTSGL